MPTIIQALPSLISGEVENGTIEIAKFLVENGYQSIVLSSGGEMVEELKHSLSKHIQINIDSKNPFWIYKNIAIINKIMQDLEPPHGAAIMRQKILIRALLLRFMAFIARKISYKECITAL